MLKEMIENELKKKDISQIKLSKEIGISQGTIYKILHTDTQTSIEVLDKVANYFHVPVAQFLCSEVPAEWTRKDRDEVSTLLKQILEQTKRNTAAIEKLIAEIKKSNRRR